MMNSVKYESLLRSCIRDVMTICLKTNVPADVESASVSTARIYLNDILTTHAENIPYYINKKIDTILHYELSTKHIVQPEKLFRLTANNQISLFKGDITTIHADCIVNAANSNGLGCFISSHKCIDNAIHSKAGPRLREECRKKLGSDTIPPGKLITTFGYNLPSRYVFHVVGPIYDSNRIKYHEAILVHAYTNCLNQMKEMGLETIVFPCISTGEYAYPKHAASVVAILVVKKWLADNEYPAHVIFCVYSDEDKAIYENNIRTYL